MSLEESEDFSIGGEFAHSQARSFYHPPLGKGASVPYKSLTWRGPEAAAKLDKVASGEWQVRKIFAH